MSAVLLVHQQHVSLLQMHTWKQQFLLLQTTFTPCLVLSWIQMFSPLDIWDAPASPLVPCY